MLIKYNNYLLTQNLYVDIETCYFSVFSCKQLWMQYNKIDNCFYLNYYKKHKKITSFYVYPEIQFTYVYYLKLFNDGFLKKCFLINVDKKFGTKLIVLFRKLLDNYLKRN